jgi:hypothetical protein
VTAALACATTALGGTISGQVFRDYNSNGAKNAGGVVGGSSVAATDAAMAGVIADFANITIDAGVTVCGAQQAVVTG